MMALLSAAFEPGICRAHPIPPPHCHAAAAGCFRSWACGLEYPPPLATPSLPALCARRETSLGGCRIPGSFSPFGQRADVTPCLEHPRWRGVAGRCLVAAVVTTVRDACAVTMAGS